MKLRIKKYDKKIVSYILVGAMLAGCIQGLDIQRVNAADNAFETSIKDFPESYKVYLRVLHSKYPNWTFKAYKTNIDFATAVDNESAVKKSLVEKSFDDTLKSRSSENYNASTGTYIYHDSGRWVGASKNTVAYFMDPRNFLNDSNICMFEQLSYDSSIHTQTGVESVLAGSFMSNVNMAYLTSSKTYKTYNPKTKYSEQFMAAGKAAGVSPYYLASKSLLEVGSTKNASYAGMGAGASVNGAHATYPGIYNFYNIGASDSADPVSKGLRWAKGGSENKTTYQRPWDNPAKAISGGALYIAEQYIKVGQDTSYFQRFNVQSKASKLYEHQYMTSVYGCASESITTMNTYKKIGIAGLKKSFIIPVYNNMPDEKTSIRIGSANKSGVATANVNVRSTPHTTSVGEKDNIVGKLSTNDLCNIIECAQTDIVYDGSRWLNNPYWYKIRINKNGTTLEGYVSAYYIDLNPELTVIKGISTSIDKAIGNNETAYYEVDDPSILTVDANGNVKGLKEGTTTVRAYTKGGNFSAMAINVLQKGVVLSNTRINMELSKSFQLTATVYPTSTTNKKVTWSSNNTKVATVSSTGLVKSVGYGSTTITCTADIGGVVGKCVVVVEKPVKSVKLDKSSVKVGVGAMTTLNATVSPSDATNKSIIWKSSDTKVATVKDGVVTGKAVGSATITATSADGKKKDTCTVYVRPGKVTGIKLKNTSPTKIKIAWNAVSGVTGYKVYRLNSNGKYKSVAKTTKNSYTNKKLTTGVKYKYKIAAYVTVNGKDVIGIKSKPLIKKAAPPKTSVSVELLDTDKAVLSWKKSKKADGYAIYRKSSAESKYTVKLVKGVDTLTRTESNLTPGETYNYKVRSYKYSGGKRIYSAYSNIVSVTR
ncbi:MAG: hypothetical protein E7254_10400 [Lachnospiraceae bacterium]|nr:hypothetical protein [Lachnospiraceae bacterium]